MKVLFIFTTAALLSMIGVSSAKDDAVEPYVYGKDPKKDAEYDISMGMAGIQQAAQDPKLLAQLFQDMQVREYAFRSFLLRFVGSTLLWPFHSFFVEGVRESCIPTRRWFVDCGRFV
jgi:hypothetical protein